MLPAEIGRALSRDAHGPTSVSRGQMPHDFTVGRTVPNNAPNAGGMGTRVSHSGNSDLAIGSDTVNGSINYAIFIDSEKTDTTKMGGSMLSFIRVKVGAQHRGAKFPTFSLSALNHMLKYDLGYLAEFNQKT